MRYTLSFSVLASSGYIPRSGISGSSGGFGEGNGNPLWHSCLENPVDRGAWWAAVHGVVQSQTWLKRLSMHACTGEGNCNPLQYSCLENPRDRGAWWTAVCGVAQSRTRLKWLSSCKSWGVGWCGRWEGGTRGRGHMYIYGWLMLIHGRNQHNTIKQLSFS